MANNNGSNGKKVIPKTQSVKGGTLSGTASDHELGKIEERKAMLGRHHDEIHPEQRYVALRAAVFATVNLLPTLKHYKDPLQLMSFYPTADARRELGDRRGFMVLPHGEGKHVTVVYNGEKLSVIPEEVETQPWAKDLIGSSTRMANTEEEEAAA